MVASALDWLKKRTLAEAEVQGLVLCQAETRCQWKGFRAEHGSGKQFDSSSRTERAKSRPQQRSHGSLHACNGRRTCSKSRHVEDDMSGGLAKGKARGSVQRATCAVGFKSRS
jgi:hypothetical protein